MSATRKARRRARATARVWWSISSIVTGRGIFVAQHDHAERVADQDHVDAGFVDQACGGIVIRGERCDRTAGEFFLKKCVGGDAGGGKRGSADAELSNAHGFLQCHSAIADAA